MPVVGRHSYYRRWGSTPTFFWLVLQVGVAWVVRSWSNFIVTKLNTCRLLNLFLSNILKNFVGQTLQCVNVIGFIQKQVLIFVGVPRKHFLVFRENLDIQNRCSYHYLSTVLKKTLSGVETSTQTVSEPTRMTFLRPSSVSVMFLSKVHIITGATSPGPRGWKVFICCLIMFFRRWFLAD